MKKGLLATLRMFGRYAVGIRGFLKRPLDSEACRRIVIDQHRRRQESFLAMLKIPTFDGHLN